MRVRETNAAARTALGPMGSRFGRRRDASAVAWLRAADARKSGGDEWSGRFGAKLFIARGRKKWRFVMQKLYFPPGRIWLSLV